jgi:membrane protease YdiL (CAAX protease family)
MSAAVMENSHDTKQNTLVKRLTEDQHSLLLSIALHLIPSVLILAAYLMIAAPLVEVIGYPPYLGWVVAMCIALAPVELGLLFYLGWRKNGRLSLRGVVDYMEKPVKKLALGGIVTILIIGLYIASIILTPVDTFIYKHLFSWIPFASAAGGGSGYLSGYARSTVIVTLAVSVIFQGIILPTIEELYFRGYLLPRLSRLGRLAPILNMILFSLYHVWTPWQFVSRIGFFLPTVWVTWLRKDLRISILVHCISNTLLTLISLIAIILGSSY